MPRGICLTVGLNDFDRSSPAYAGVQAAALQGCVNDAQSIANLVRGLPNYDPPVVLTDSAATHDAVLAQIAQAAQVLQPDDLFVLHYSGHGMRGTMDEAGTGNPDSSAGSSWILYDRPLSSDLLLQSWGPFREGVRILVFSDSCHSGSAIKGVRFREFGGVDHAPRELDRQDRFQVLNNLANYFPRYVIQRTITRSAGALPGATLLLISGCQIDQTSLDSSSGGVPGGLFTTTLVGVWANGGFTGDYNTFYQEILKKTHDASVQIDSNSPQDPNFFPLGNPDDLMIFAGSSPPFYV